MSPSVQSCGRSYGDCFKGEMCTVPGTSAGGADTLLFEQLLGATQTGTSTAHIRTSPSVSMRRMWPPVAPGPAQKVESLQA
jgi:hypothetical protein